MPKNVVFTKVLHGGVISEGDTLTQLLCELCDEDQADLILTTGGTGFTKRDTHLKQL